MPWSKAPHLAHFEHYENKHFSKYLRKRFIRFVLFLGMNLELIEAFDLSYISYFGKFLFAGGMMSKVKFDIKLTYFGHISGAVCPDFLKILHELTSVIKNYD